MSEKKLCQICRKNPAVIHYRRVINSESRELFLCRECAEKEGYTENLSWISEPFGSMGDFPDPFDSFGSFGKILSGFFAPQSIGYSGEKTLPAETCPNCGMTFAELRHTNRFGCPDCYKAFKDRINLEPFTSKKGYRGRKPLNDDSDDNKTSPWAKASEKRKKDAPSLSELKAKLKSAVEKEDYETAAKLRDAVRAMEKENSESTSEKKGDTQA